MCVKMQKNVQHILSEITENAGGQAETDTCILTDTWTAFLERLVLTDQSVHCTYLWAWQG